MPYKMGFLTQQISTSLRSDRIQRIYKPLIYIVVILLAAFWFYHCASLHFNAYNNFCVYATDDVSDYNQAAWNTAKGRLFQYNDRHSEEVILAHKDIRTIELHSNFIFLLISLLYLILPHFASFVIIQSLFMALSIIALYLVARELAKEKVIIPLLIVLIYTQYFPLTNIAHFFHPEEFSMFFIFLAFYFYLKNNLKLTLLFAILSIFCREEISIIFMTLGIISYFKADKKRYALGLIFLGLVSFLYIKLVMTKAVTAPEILKIHYGYLGETFLDKVKNIIFHPSLIINNVLKPHRATLFKDIFEPLLYLPFLTPILFIPGLVILLEVMLSNSWSMGTLRWQPWYLCPLIPFIFIALTGSFEKIYRLKRLNKTLPFILIGFLFSYIYIQNFNLTKFNNNGFRDYFAVNRYWRGDIFAVLSGIKEEAKVACSLKLMPMLSSRRYVTGLDTLTEKIVNQGFYDIIILSEGDYRPDIGGYLALLKDNHLYRKVYYTPYMSVFAKKDSALTSEDWRFNLTSEIKNSTLSHNYMILNFTDYASILENSNNIEPEALVRELYQNQKLHYAMLEPGPAQLNTHTLNFVSPKPLEKNYSYILAFAAKTEKNTEVIYIKKPTDNAKEWTEIKIDDKLRLFILPFDVSHLIPSSVVALQIKEGCSVLRPILLRCPPVHAEDVQLEPVLEVSVNKYKISYNPWLESQHLRLKSRGNAQFLRQRIDNNILLYLMKFLNFALPGDLYRYSWVSRWNKSSEIIAIRY